MKLSFKAILKPALPLVVICLVVSLVLSLTNMLTADRIAQLQKEKETAAMQRIYNCDVFEKGTVDVGCEYYIAEEKGLIFNVKTNGYGGQITVMVGVNCDLTVKAVEIIDVSGETVGLGQRAAEESFYSQFVGKVSGITVSKNSVGENQIKAITGATISSQAVTDAVNTALEYAEMIIGTASSEGGAN